MSRALINRSPDLRRLEDDGFVLEVVDGHLTVPGIPYLKPDKTVGFGTLVSSLMLAGDVTTTPDTHVAMFSGGVPCGAQGISLPHIIQSIHQRVGTTLTIDCMFSSKPTSGAYSNYYDKMSHHIALISGPAEFVDPTVAARKRTPIEETPDDSPFVYMDNASARAGIASINAKLSEETVAIIGLGGTGAYVLDFIAKTPVRQIDIFDADEFSQHNAFRAPGAPSIDELRARPSKVAYLFERYSKMHKRIRAHENMIDESTAEALRSATIVFMCIDRGSEKPRIIELLESFGSTFIDVGMGIQATDEKLHGILRVTTSTPHDRAHIHESHRIPMADGAKNEYAANIQIAELNALNAALAVIKWKKLRGIYADLEQEHHALYTIDGNNLINEDHATE